MTAPATVREPRRRADGARDALRGAPRPRQRPDGLGDGLARAASTDPDGSRRSAAMPGSGRACRRDVPRPASARRRPRHSARSDGVRAPHRSLGLGRAAPPRARSRNDVDRRPRSCSWPIDSCANPTWRRTGSPSASSTRRSPRDPERTWQLLRRAAREAADWITVDSLAHPMGEGILAEPYRWAELEQLVYSPSRWERRLVGLHDRHDPVRGPDRGTRPGGRPTRALELLGRLIGDAEPGRAEGPRLGLPLPRRRRPRADDRRRCERRPTVPPGRRTAIAPGSSATPSRAPAAPTPTGSASASPASAPPAGRRRPRVRPRRPRASA